MIENNRTAVKLTHAVAYTNNTFNLDATTDNIKNRISNSFHYLKELQKSYINIHRFSLTEEDIFIMYDGKACVSVDKDFIDPAKRKKYRSSEFYDKFISLSDIENNRDIFSFIPMVFVDNKSVFSVSIKCSLDGRTVIRFDDVRLGKDFANEIHNIEVAFLFNIYYHQLITNKFFIQKYDWKVPVSALGITKSEISDLFLFIRAFNGGIESGSNIIKLNIENGVVIFDKDNPIIFDTISNNREVEMDFISMDAKEISGYKEIYTRTDNNRQSSLVVINDDNGETCPMAIPVENLIVLRVNKTTNEVCYENNKTIILHYPNIYEIMSDDIDDPLDYYYKIYYLYKETSECLSYRNEFKYIYRFISRKMGLPLEDALITLLYSNDGDPDLKDYFLSIFDYEDKYYKYNHGDFFVTSSPYDFDYKTDKLHEFIDYDPYVLQLYAERVNMPIYSYCLDVRNINLPDRIRNTTENEAIRDIDIMSFDEPHYLFVFRHEHSYNISLRFFIDGILTTELTEIYSYEMAYIYVPCRLISEDSYIEIERFHTYSFNKTMNFSTHTEPITLDFSENEFITPTLYDLFVTDSDRNVLDRSKFKIYALINKDEYNISEEVVSVPSHITPDISYENDDMVAMLLDNSLYQDTGTGQWYLDIDELLVDGTFVMMDDELSNEAESAVNTYPLRYMTLRKLKVFCNDINLLNKDLSFVVNKVPFLISKKMKTTGVPKFNIFNDRIAWREEPSYIRTFVNGKLVPLTYNVYTDPASRDHYFTASCIIEEGDEITVDITPYSYELEFSMDEVPDDYLVSFNGRLSKPFSLKYYDIYVNGRKLHELNVHVITPDKIQLCGMKSKYNLLVYRKDRDYEYYGFTNTVSIPLDRLLSLPSITQDDKKSIIRDIIGHDPVNENTEDNVNDIRVLPQSVLSKYRFYVDILLPRGVVKPNDFGLDKEYIELMYKDVYDDYANESGTRIVMRPNTNWEATSSVLMIGKPSQALINDMN